MVFAGNFIKTSTNFQHFFINRFSRFSTAHARGDQRDRPRYSGSVNRPHRTLKLIHTATPDTTTVLSVSRPLRRCELDSRQLKTVADRKFEV